MRGWLTVHNRAVITVILLVFGIALGGGAARTLGALRERIPGASQATGQGVSVEVGETQAAVDLDRENVVALKALAGILSHEGRHSSASRLRSSRPLICR